MQIWVDADACPSVIKDILFRARLDQSDRKRFAVELDRFLAQQQPRATATPAAREAH